MATMPNMQDEQEDPNAMPDEQAPDEGAPAEEQAMPDGGDPKQAIGYIDQRLPAKIRVFLKSAKAVLIADQGAAMLRKVMSSTNDYVKALAQLIERTIQSLENKLGPLADQEHDTVAFYLAGWLVSSLQAMGMPHLDTPEGRQHLIGLVMQALDEMTQGPPQGAPDAQGAAPPPAGPDAGAPPAPPQGGTLPQLGA